MENNDNREPAVTGGNSQTFSLTSLSDFVVQHTALLFTGTYLMASAIGMLDSWWYYRQFGINIFYYSDLADFLLASFRSPTVWLVVLLTIVVFAYDLGSSRRDALRSNPSWYARLHGSTLYRRLGWALMLPVIGVYILVYAHIRAVLVLEQGGGQTVAIILANTEEAEVSGILLGSSMNFIYLLHRESNTVQVHPYDNVVTVKYQLARPQPEQVEQQSSEQP